MKFWWFLLFPQNSDIMKNKNLPQLCKITQNLYEYTFITEWFLQMK